MLFKGNSSKLELLIEKIQANKEGGSEETGSLANEEVSVGVGSSWDVGSDGRGGSLSPASSRATPTSAGEVTDVEAAATLGVTSQTPYQCAFCDRAFPRLSYLKRHEQTHKSDASASTSSLFMALNNDVACSPTSKSEYKKDYTDSSTSSNVAVVWCTKPTILLSEGSFPQSSSKKVTNPVSFIPRYPDSENIVVSNATNVCTSTVTSLSQPLEIKTNEKKLYCYTSAGLVSKPAVFSASLSTNYSTNNSLVNQLEAKRFSKGSAKVDGMQCIVSSMTGNVKKSEGKRKVSDYEVTKAVERVVKNKNNLIAKNCYQDNGNKYRKVEVCFPNSNKNKLNEKGSPLICEVTSGNFKSEKDSSNIKASLPAQVPIHSIVSLNSDSSKSRPPKDKLCTSSINQNIKNTTNKNVSLEVGMPQIVVPLTSTFGEISVQIPDVITQKDLTYKSNEFCDSNENFPYKISPNICAMPSNYVMNNTLGNSSVQTNKFMSLQNTDTNSNINPPIPNISISLVSIKPVPVVSETREGTNPKVKDVPTYKKTKNINVIQQTTDKVSSPASVSVNTIENSINTDKNIEDDDDDDGGNGLGNVWVEEKMYSFVKEELRQLGDPVSGDGVVLANNKESVHQSKCKNINSISIIDTDDPKPKDESAATDSTGEIITEDVFSYIENELMRLDAMDDITEPLNTSLGDMSSSTSVDSSVNDSGFCPSGMRTPDSSQCSRQISLSSSVISTDENWSLLSSKGSMDLHNITASSDISLDVALNDIKPYGRRSTFSEFDRPNKIIKPRLRRFSISDSHGTLNIEKSPGEEPLLCLKDLDLLKNDKSNNSNGNDSQTIENSDPIETIGRDELCKVKEKSTIETSCSDSLELSSLDQYKDRQELKPVSNNIPKNVDTEIHNTLIDYKTNISSIIEIRKDNNSQIRKEDIENFTKKRSMTQIDSKDAIDSFSKKSKKMEQEQEFIEIESVRIENVEEKPKTNDNQLPCNVITNAYTVTSEMEFIPNESLSFDLKGKMLLKSMDTEEISTLNLENMVNNSDVHSTSSSRKTLNVQIPLTHVQLSQKHYDVMSRTSPIISNLETNTVNPVVNVSFHEFLSSPILKKIEPFHYQCTPPHANRQKQKTSPVISPISPALPQNCAMDLPDSCCQLPIITLKTPVSINATTASIITNTAASTTDVFVTPPSFQSSSSSTVTLEETPSPPASIGSDSPYECQSVLYHNMESDRDLAMNDTTESRSTKSSLTNNAKSNYLNINSYGEYLNTYLKYLKPQSLNDKISDTSLPSLYLTGNTSLHSDLYTLKEEAVMKKCRSQDDKGLFLSKVPFSDQVSKNFISKLGVFNSKNDKEIFTSGDLHNAIDGTKTNSINSSVDIGHITDQFDEMEFPKRLKDLKETKISPSENNNETRENNVKNNYTNVQQIKKTNCEISNDDLCGKLEEHLEEETDIDAKLPSVHIQVRTGALAEQRGKSRAILSKLSQPLIHVGHKRHCKVTPKVILIRTGLNSPDSSPTNNETGKTDVLSDSIFDESYDRKFSAENLMYKSSSQTGQDMENDFKIVKKQNESNFIYPNLENLCSKAINSNITSNTDLNKEFTTKNDISIGINNKDEIDVSEKTNSDMNHGCINSDNEQGDDSLKKKQSNRVINSDVNFININEWKDSTKSIVTKKSSNKNKDKKIHDKELLRKSSKEKEIFSENNSEFEGGKIYFMGKSEESPGITNMKNIKVKANFKDFDNKIADMRGIEKDLCPSILQEEDEKEYQKPLLETGKESGALVPDLNHTVHNFGTCSGKDLKENKNMLVNVDAVENTAKPVDLRSPDETNDLKITNVDKSKLNNKENSKFILDNSYKSQSPTSSVINKSNSDSIQNNSKSLINKSNSFQGKCEQDPGNVGNIKCITKVIEGTAVIRAAIRKKKKHAAKVKRNNIAKGRRKKAEKVLKKSAYVSKSRKKSTLKEIRKNKIISYSRDGEVFDPNNLSTVSGDALMAGITVHCTPEGVTLKLNCVENMDSEILKSGNLSLKSNKSCRAQSISKTKETFIATSSSKKKHKCKDKYLETSTTANQVSSVDHSVNADMPQSSLVSSNTEVTKYNKKSLGVNDESIEESGNAITESVNPSKSVLELFEDFESLLGSMEDGDPQTKSTSNYTPRNPVSQSRTQGIENTVTLNGSSSFSTVVDCSKSVPTNSLQSNTTTSITTNTESSSEVVQMLSDNCNHNTNFSAAGKPLNIIEKIDKTAGLSNAKKTLEKCKSDVDTNSKMNNTYEIGETNELSQSQVVYSKQERPQLENISLKDKNSLQRNCSTNKSLSLSDKYNNPNKQERLHLENISLKNKNSPQARNCPSSKILPLSDKYNNQSKQERLHFENITLKDKQARLQSENIGLKDKNYLKGRNFPSSKSLPLYDKFNNPSGKNFASKEIQINYKMPTMTKKCTFSLNKNENNTNTSHGCGKKSKRKNLFENKACQSNSITNIYSRNSSSQRESNSGFKEGKKKLKLSKQTDINMQTMDSCKGYEYKKDRNNNEFKHDHNYNSRRIKNKGKHKDLKVNSSKKTDSVMQNSSINHTKKLLNPKMCVNQRGKLKIPLKKQNIGSSMIDHANVTNKSVTEKELLTRESICNVYKENDVIAVSKTSIMLNKNTKGKSNVPFEHETESAVKSTTCTDDLSNNLENLNVKKIKANVKVQKTELNNECPTISLNDIGSDKFSSGFYSEKTFYSENEISLTDKEISVKSTESTPKTADLGSEESHLDTKVNSPIETCENIYNKLINENEENDFVFPKQDFNSNSDTNENPQSSPDSPHFGLIHKLAQTSANSGYTKIVVKKVRSSSIDKKKSQGLLSSTLKRNAATRTGDLSGIQLQVKNDINPGKEFSDVCKENIISTKDTTKIENSFADVHSNKDKIKSNLSKCDSNIDHEKEGFGINSTEQQTEDMFKELFEKSSDNINNNSDNRITPLDNLGAVVDKHLQKVDNAYTELEQKRFNIKDINNDSKFMSAENSSVISLDNSISKDKNFGYSDITEAVMPVVHTFISTPEENFEVKESHNFDNFSANVIAHNYASGGCDQAQSNTRIMGNLQPLDLRLERSEVPPCAPNGTRLTSFSYSVDLDSGLVNVISTEGPEYADNINSEVLRKNGEIKATDISATPACISPVYAVQTVDNCSAAAINDGPLIMPVYSVCETKAIANTTQVMQIYSYSAEEFSIRNYDSKSIYANAASISSVISPNLSITNTGGCDDGSLVVPVYSIASSNNINICNSNRLTENSTILETSQTLPVYLLNSFDSSNALPCTQISTVYTSNIVNESINSFPSEPVYGPQLIPIYSVETGNNVSNTAIGINQLNSTSENEGEIGNLHHLGVSDLSAKNLSGGNIVVNVEYVENITKSLEQESLEKDSALSIKSDPENLDHYVQKGAADISTSIVSDSEHNDIDNIRESTNYDYVKNITEIGNLDDPESSSEISNMECPEHPVDTGNLEYGDGIKSEPEDDEFSNTDIGGNHVGSEGGVGMDFLLLDSLTHADQLPFRCEFCGRLFKHKRSRDRHVKLHTGDKKYKCCHCEAAFSRSDHLKIHMKTHDTQKPYQCSVCNRGYNTAAALTAHMQNHKAKLTAHALNQLLKDAQESPDANTLSALLKDSSQNPADAAALSQLLKEASSAPPPEGHPLSHLLLRESPTDHHTLNHFLKDPPKEQLESPRVVERGAAASPGGASPSPGRENGSPASSPIAAVPCLICHVTCRNHTHLQRHMSRHHSEDSGDRPASRGGSGTSSTGGGVSSGVSSTPSTPSPRPPSSLPSPRPPIPNPFMFLVGGKLSCIYCSRDGFLSLEALQMHIQSQHSALLNGDSRDMANVLNLPSPLGSSLGAGGLNLNTLSPLAPSSSRGVTCELCGARVSGVTALQRHVVTAHTFTDLLARAAEGVFCAQCLLPFSNPGALAEHIKLVHASPVLSAVLNKRPPSPPNDAPTDLSKKTRRCDNLSDLPANTLLCSQCNAPFTNFEAFRRHLKTHLEGNDQVGSSLSGSQQLVCPECRLPLTSETALEVHLATHLGATCTEYGCQACLKLFQKPDELQKHLMDIHAHHLYRCALCKEMFDSKVSIQVHFAVKHSNECKVHKCTRCSLIFRTQSEFEAHVRSSHLRLPNGDGNGGNALGNGSSSNGMYRCLLCTLSLSSEAELAAHVSTHQRQFHCSLCDDAFHVEFLLDKHMQSAHNSELNGNIPQPENLAKPRRSPLKKDLKCDICDADFSSESALLGHRKQAHNIKNNSGNNNNNNTKIAAAALSLFCAYCSEACKSRADLEIHMKSHQSSGGRHKCNICDDLCPSAALLAQHKLSHIKVLSGNSCAVCREPLTSEHQFTSHQNEHHPAPLPQPCVVCRQTLVTDIEVNVHARFHSVQAAHAQVTSVASAILSSTLQSTPVITTAATACHTNSESNSRNCTSPRLSPRLRCPECNVKLETPEEAEAHAQVHQSQQKQNSSARTYQCIKCQESFASESEIEAHVASHLLHEGSTHECHLCRGTFDTPLRLQCHLIEHTFEGCGSFTCYMCSSVFTTAPRLQQHMVEHGLAARPYDCHHCHQKFFFRAELENHALSHPEATDGSCRECLASYPDLPRFHNRRPWPVLATVEATTAATRISPARPTQDGSPQQAQQGQQEGEEAPPSTNGHSNPEADPLEEEELQP